MQKIEVAVLGATGAVGQRFIQLLENHPWFRVGEVIGSSRSAERPFGEAANWVLDGAPPAAVADLVVKPLEAELSSPLVFSALPREAAVTREPELAAAGHIVCTNASAHRMAEDVPLLLPEANADHVELIEVQRRKRGWSSGALIANSNCTAMPVVMALAPLRQFDVRKAFMVSAQAISGAGYPGVASLDIQDNVIPFVSGDEEKLETETWKMLGRFTGEQVEPLAVISSASCNRVPVVDGHLVIVSIQLEERPELESIIAAWETFRGPEPVPQLPSAPERPVQYLSQVDRPQIRRDRNAGSGMATTVGRLRPCPLLGYKFAALAHNTIRGAAGGSILNAELLAAKGFLGRFQPALSLAGAAAR